MTPFSESAPRRQSHHLNTDFVNVTPLYSDCNSLRSYKCYFHRGYFGSVNVPHSTSVVNIFLQRLSNVLLRISLHDEYTPLTSSAHSNGVLPRMALDPLEWDLLRRRHLLLAFPIAQRWM